MDTPTDNQAPAPLETGDIQRAALDTDIAATENETVHGTTAPLPYAEPHGWPEAPEDDIAAIANDADIGVEFHATEDGICPDCGKPASEHEDSGIPVEKLISPEWVVGDEEAEATLTSLVENIGSLLAEKFPGVALACAVSFGGHAGRLMIFPEFLQNIADKPAEDQGKLAVTLLHGIASLGNQTQGILNDIRKQLDDATIRSAAKAAMLQVVRDQAAAGAKDKQKPELN